MSHTDVILLVEDQDADLLLILTAFKTAGLTAAIQVARSGSEALAYLSGEGKYGNRVEYPLPRLVLLNLRMPGIDGYALLMWIRQQDGLRGLPVLVLTSSTLIPDVNRAYQLGANSFLVKDVDFQHATTLVQALKKFWIHPPASELEIQTGLPAVPPTPPSASSSPPSAASSPPSN